jgi:hypothetical protein
MPTNSNLPSSQLKQPNGGTTPALPIDFVCDAVGNSVMFLPTSNAGQAWADTGGFHPHAKWLGVYIVSRAEVNATVSEMLIDGLHMKFTNVYQP